MTPRTVLFAGGGSGGHLSPALAVAERLTACDRESRSVFACSSRAIDRTMLSEAAVHFEALHARPFSLHPLGLARFGAGLARAVGEARRLIRREGVTHVVAMGGFVAAPVVLAARLAGVPVTLVNLDAPPGLANRLLRRLCPQVLSAIALPEHRRFAQVVGMPIRAAARAPADARTCRGQLGLIPARATLLVTGASQGSRSINALMEAMCRSADARALSGWQVLHLCGDADGEGAALRDAYAAAGVFAIVQPFSHQMGLCWGSADLALSRAGASSVAEAWANRVPAVFLPYPYHRDQHQLHNARPMVEAGGAVVETDLIDAEANRRGPPGKSLARLLADEPRRRAMQRALREHPAPDGAVAIVETLIRAGSGLSAP